VVGRLRPARVAAVRSGRGWSGSGRGLSVSRRTVSGCTGSRGTEGAVFGEGTGTPSGSRRRRRAESSPSAALGSRGTPRYSPSGGVGCGSSVPTCSMTQRPKPRHWRAIQPPARARKPRSTTVGVPAGHVLAGSCPSMNSSVRALPRSGRQPSRSTSPVVGSTRSSSRFDGRGQLPVPASRPSSRISRAHTGAASRLPVASSVIGTGRSKPIHTVATWLGV
jgi:hypothetical protein